MTSHSILRFLLALFTTASTFAAENFDSIYISELLANPTKKHGWIELHNASSYSINLANWYLSDSTNQTKWRFPEVVMLPDTYLVINTSGKPNTDNLADLHANFSLDPNGGQLTLNRGGTNQVSHLHYPKTPRGHSYGSLRAEPATRANFTQPTPGKPNQTKGPGFAPPVTFSHPSATFTAPFEITLTTTETNATIRYTTDGALPSANSPTYTAPLQITNTTTIRARAYQPNQLPGPPQSQTYLALATNLLKFKSTLPILVIHTLGQNSPSATKAPYFSFHEPSPADNNKTSLTNRPTLVTRAQFHVRGSSTQGMPQPSLAVEFLDEFNDDQSHPLLGLPSNSDWVLYAPNMFDPVLIHNPFIHQLARDMGHYSSRTRFLEVYIVLHPGQVTPQDYAGLYVLEEKIKIGKNRVNIDKLGPDDLAEPDLTGGYLLKFDRNGPGERGLWAGGAEIIYVDPKEEVIELPQRAPQQRYLAKYLDDLAKALQSPDWKDPVKGYPAYIDVNNWIDYHTLEVLSGNVDIFRYSTYFYKPRNGKLSFGPHWDYDRALGSIDRRDNYPRRWNTGRFFNGPWWGKILSDPDFWQLWVDRWQTLRQTHFSQTNLDSLIDQLANQVREAQPRQAARWNLYPRGENYQSEIDWMKKWLAERIDYIDNQLTQPPKIEKSTTELTLTAEQGATIYYTTNNTDPRLSGGAINPTAKLYETPINISGATTIKARAKNEEKKQQSGPPISTPWSMPVTATPNPR